MSRPAASEDTPCNLCGASDYDVVGTADREGQPLRTVMCRRCGLVWINPRPSIADMDAYYATEYRADYTGTRTPPLRKIVRGMLGAIDRRRSLRPLLGETAAHHRVAYDSPPQKAPHEPRKVLDVGCGAGEFVYLLRREGIDASGIEPGREYADFARQVLRVPIQTATVQTAVVSPDSQDLVTMFHALEHVPDPKAVLATVRGWLKKGAMAVVEVPNVESTVQAPAHRFHYAHLHHFTGATLGALGEAAGLRLVRTYYSADGGNVTCVFRRQTDQPHPPTPALEAPAARLRSILASHTPVRHYLSPTPYNRALGRLRRRWREDRLLRRLKTVDDVLAWAADRM
jgi:2-polyprenyl-3-methyl-5-hydroxy-6-metoxy-1,4-benzoquinol methylase